MPQLKIKYNKDTQKAKRSNEKSAENIEESKYLTTRYYRNGDLALEHEQNLNAEFNYESHVVDDGCCSRSSSSNRLNRIGTEAKLQQKEYEHKNVNASLTSDKFNEARDLTCDEHTYENLTYEKELLLHKFFRSRNAIYENLCRGCGYGVFEARGELCYFCASIVNGVQNTPGSTSASASATASTPISVTDLDFINNTNNIYENICEKCYTIYNTETCEFCQLKNVEKTKKNLRNLISSNDELSTNSKIDGVKLTKSKSFNKRCEKRGIFQGIIGSLKRAPKVTKTNNSVSASKLEIIHNVDGYEQVFRTQETFDLQRICELKQAQHSSSEQHIYGRLKFAADKSTETLSNSTQTLPIPKVLTEQKQLTKAESESSYLNSTFDDNNYNYKSKTIIEKNSNLTCKRPRISKPSFLRAITSATQNNNSFNGKITKTKTQAAVNAPNSKLLKKQQHQQTNVLVKEQSLYLAVSVCNWMTSLRHEVHAYHDFAEELCKPKSIPARNTLITYYTRTIGAIDDVRFIGTKNSMTNSLNINNVIAIGISTHTQQQQNNSKHNNDVSTVERSVTSECTSTVNTHNEFAVTLRSNQTIAQVLLFDEQTPVACIQMVRDFMKNLLAKKEVIREMSHKNMESEQLEESKCELEILEGSDLIRKRQAAQQRAKRQAIYLKTHELNEMCMVNNSNNNNNNSKIKENAINQITKINNEEQEPEKFIAADINKTNKQKIPNENSENNNNNNDFEAELDSTALNKSPVSRRRTVTAYGEGEFSNISDSRKRCGVYELKVENEFVGDILNDFDKYLQYEEAAIEAAEAKTQVTAAYRETEKGSSTSVAGAKDINSLSPLEKQSVLEHFINFVKLTEDLHLARSLHRIVISYAQPLHAFLKAIHLRYPNLYAKWPKHRLNKKYKKFHNYCIEKKNLKALPTSLKFNKTTDSFIKTNKKREYDITKNFEDLTKVKPAVSDALNVKRNSVKIIVQQVKIQSNDMVTTTTMTSEKKSYDKEKEKFHNKTPATIETYMTSVDEINKNNNNNVTTKKNFPLKPHRVAPKKPEPPQVPQRDPKTFLSSKFSPKANKTESQKTTNATTIEEEENIYHPIWNFKTVGEVPEHYQTDVDYYEIGNDIDVTAITAKQFKNFNNDTDSLASFVLTANNDIEEDHGEWETDDEFMFTTDGLSAKAIKQNNQAPDVSSLHSSIATSMQSTSSLSGSTVAGFSSSTATLASGISVSLTHHLLRNIGIFYSLTEPKLRAIVYDYDRLHASAYFAKRLPLMPPTTHSPCSNNESNESNCNDSGIGKSPKLQRSPMPPPRTTSVAKGSCNNTQIKKSSESGCHAAATTTVTAKTPQLLPDSVLAWKFMLLDVNYLEDEEDMIVSAAEIKRAQDIKEDIDTRQTQQLNIFQRFKSASIGNLIDLPNEDDKVGIGSAIDRMRSKLQRGVFKINVRSPKSDKKNRGIFRKTEVTSLYLEDGMKPKYPIFGAPLEKLEMDQTTYHNVPRFVVDCVACIEQKGCILQEGLYRASGNKVSVEELKRKLSESYVYDPKLLVTDDIHTLTSLLKLFFRELVSPLIPQDIYERLGRSLSDTAGIEKIREAFEDIPEPNLSTLKFLIKHLTNVAVYSSDNRMPASNLAIVWGPCLLSANQIEFDIGRMNTLAKVLIENYARIFNESERLVA